MLVVLDKETARASRKFAWECYRQGGEALDIWKSWMDNIRYLQSYACKREYAIDPTRVVVTASRDGAPYSFALAWWERKELTEHDSGYSRQRIREMLEAKDWDPFLRKYRHWMSGGLIYHGPHDRFGSGDAPTFSVSLGRTTAGWEIHT
jgi:hypothetical protein